MNFKGQHIGGIFTFLAGLILFAHAVVPHHHHFEITHSSEKEAACETPVQGQNPDVPAPHCHAFNVLISENTITTSLNHSLSDHFNFGTAGIIVQIETPSAKDITTTIFYKHADFIKQFFFTAHSLRAPPAIA